MVLKAAAAIISAVLTIASVGYQIYQSQKLKAQQKAAEKARKEAEDARKGFEQVVEGQSTILPIVYGKAMVGGARVFHAVSGNYNYVEPNAEKTLGKYSGGKTYSTEACKTIQNIYTTEGIDNDGAPVQVPYAWVYPPPSEPINSQFQGWWWTQRRRYKVVQIPGITDPPYVGLLPYQATNDKAIIDSFSEEYPETFSKMLDCEVANIDTIKLQRIVKYDNKDFIWVYPEVRNNNTGLETTIHGTKNEFLFYQQALCQGPIEGVYDVVIDDNRYLDDVELGNETEWETDSDGDIQRVTKEAGIRIDCHYGAEPRADSIMAANFYERSTAVFNNIAYASVVIRLERDYPQFNNIPNIQFFLQGKKVRTVNNAYQLSLERIYSNNPAWCLLDYLLDNTIGKGLDVSEIDLKSFYDASIICNRTVLDNVRVGGNLYFPTLDKNSGPLQGAETRPLPLYECNIIINSEKTIRENVEEILSTMGDARLVWSQGKYKLSLQYPESNEAINLAATLTDDDLILNQEVQITWPSASERLNHCIIKYHNETANFNESVIAWPPKREGTFWIGLGGRRYSQQDGFDSNRACGQLLNSMGVWQSDSLDTTRAYMEWVFHIKENVSGATVTFAYADAFTINLYRVSNPDSDTLISPVFIGGWSGNGDTTYPFSCNKTWDGAQGTTHSHPLGNLTGNCLYKVTIEAYVGTANNKKGAAAYIWSGSDNNKTIYWKTTDIAYTGFIKRVVTPAAVKVYTDMLAEDSGVELEKEIYLEGITDYYHALAKAEEFVRTSRSAATYKFTCNLRNKYLEPADFIKIESDALNLNPEGGLYLRVNEVKVNEDYTFDIVAERFDWTQLAWNIEDDEYLYPTPIYGSPLPAPAWLKFTKQDNTSQNTVGYLEWAKVTSPVLADYVFYYNVNLERDSTGYLKFNWMGDAGIDDANFTVPFYSGEILTYGIRARSKSGKLSGITTTSSSTPIIPPTPVYPPAVTDLAVVRNFNYAKAFRLSWTIPLKRDDGSDYDNHAGAYIYRGLNTEPDTFSKIGEVGSDTIEYTDQDPALTTNINYYYAVRLFSDRNTFGTYSNLAGPIAIQGSGPGDPPGVPTGFKVTSGYDAFFFETDPPAFDFYKITKIYGYLYDTLVYDEETKKCRRNADPNYTFEEVLQMPNGGLLKTFTGTFSSLQVGVSKGGRFWATWVKIINESDVESVPTAPQTGQTVDDPDVVVACLPNIIINIADDPDNLPNLIAEIQRLDSIVALNAISAINVVIGEIDILKGFDNYVLGEFGLIWDNNAVQNSLLKGIQSNVNDNQAFAQFRLDTLASNAATQAQALLGIQSDFNNNKAAVEFRLNTLATNDQTQAQALLGLQSDFNNNKSAVEFRLNTLATNDQTQAQLITNLTSDFNSNKSAVEFRLNTLATNDQTQAQALLGLQSEFSNNISVVNFKLNTLASNTATMAESLIGLKSDFNNNKSAVDFRLTTLSTNAQTQAQALLGLQSDFSNNISAVNFRLNTLATNDQTQAQALLDLNSNFNNNISKIDFRLNTLATNDQTQAQALLDLNSDFNNNIAKIDFRLNTLAANDQTQAQALLDLNSNFSNNIAKIDFRLNTLATNDHTQAQALLGLQSDFSNNIAKIDFRLNTLAANDQTQAQALLDLNSDFNNNKAAVDFRLNTLAANDQTQAQALLDLNSNFNNNIAKIDFRLNTLAANDQTQAQALTRLDSDFNGNKANVEFRLNTLATNDHTQAQVLTTLTSDYGNLNSSVSKINHVLTTLSSNDATQAASIGSLSSQFGGLASNISTIQQTYVNNNYVTALVQQTLSAGIYSKNLLTDASFGGSQTSSSRVTTFTNWILHSSGGAINVSVANNARGPALVTNGTEKTFFLYAESAQGSYYGDIYQTNIPIEPGKYYEASVYALAGAAVARMVVYFGTSKSAWTVMSGWRALDNTTGGTYTNGSLLTHYNRLFGVFQAGSTHVKAKFELRIDTIGGWCVAKFVRPFFTQITKERYDYLRTLTTFATSRDKLTPWDAGKSADTYSVIQQRFYTNGTHSTYGVTADVNGRISGFGFQADRGMTVFKVLADYFYISSPTNDSKPFYVDATNNIVYIQNAFIKDGSIGNAKIANAAITTAKIANAAITTAKIGNLQVDTINIKDGAVVSGALAFSSPLDASQTVRNQIETYYAPYPGVGSTVTRGQTAVYGRQYGGYFVDICSIGITVPVTASTISGLITFNPTLRQQSIYSVMIKVFKVLTNKAAYQIVAGDLFVVKEYYSSEYTAFNSKALSDSHTIKCSTGNVFPLGRVFGSVMLSNTTDWGLLTSVQTLEDVGSFVFPGAFVDISDADGSYTTPVQNLKTGYSFGFNFLSNTSYRIHAYIKLAELYGYFETGVGNIPTASWQIPTWYGISQTRINQNDSSLAVQLFLK